MPATECPQVKIIICGYERGGTTLLSDILRCNGFESGFECGVLLASKPSRFRECKPYYDMILAGWGISTDQRRAALKGTFEEFYRSITSSAFPEFQGSAFFDKTPAYMKCLGACLNKAPFIEKTLVIYRDPRAMFVSWAQRIDPGSDTERAVIENHHQFSKRYKEYFIGCAAHFNNPNVLFVPFEDLVINEEMWLQRIGVFLRHEVFQARKSKSRFGNVYSKEMRIDKVKPYGVLSEETQANILRETKICAPFFFSDEMSLKLHSEWKSVLSEINGRLRKYEISPYGMNASGDYFEPFTYLLRYPDVLRAGVNPIDHYLKSGRREGRCAA